MFNCGKIEERWGVITVLIWLGAILAGTTQASPSQYCYLADEPVIIDGKLDEKVWQDVPPMVFRDLADGKAVKFTAACRLLWDDQFLYLGFEAEATNVWATVGPGAVNPTDFADKTQRPNFIMLKDTFFKFYLDPDADGKRYVEMHINPYNFVNDTWIGHGSTSKIRQEGIVSTNVRYDWHCRNIESAVYIDGTLNESNDVDRGWSLEVALPWSDLAEFIRGACPPRPGDVWRGHFGMCYRDAPGGKQDYWTWPVIGVLDCHQTDRYGYINFSGDNAVMRKPAGKNQADGFDWKMVWLWTMGDRSDADIVADAKGLGFNALQSRNTNMVAECRKAGIEAIGSIWFGSAPVEYAQETWPEPDELMAWVNLAQWLYHFGGEPIQGGEQWGNAKPWCFDRPEAVEYGRKKIDQYIAEGYDGIAFDAVGYQNFTACCCPISRARQAEYRRQHPELTEEQALFDYSRKCLVNFNNELIKYARGKKKDIRMTCHVYPHFAPDPLYGSKMNFDYCGETAAWFFVPFWRADKVRRYAYEMVRHEADSDNPARSAPFIGIYTMSPHKQHRKTAERVREDIRIVRQSGARGIMFAELGHILADAEIAQVVREELAGHK